MSLRTSLAPLALVAVLAALALSPALAQARFQVGLQVQLSGGLPPQREPGGIAMSAVGGSLLRINVPWTTVAGSTQFNLSKPSDSHYLWSATDRAVRAAAQDHVSPMLMAYDAPTWAEGPGLPVNDPNVGTGAWEPNPAMFGQFMHALAERYSGNFPDPLNPGEALPRVRYYQLWNEPNLGGYLAGPNKVEQLRNLENAGYAAIKSVNPSNVAVGAGLAPISPVGVYSSHPLTMARGLLCLRQVRNHYVRIKGCPTLDIDTFAVHPYSLAATPTKPPFNPNDILVQNVYKLHNLINAAERLHTVSRGNHPLWVTEWSWFTNPPQTAYGDPPNVAARYVAYSMYEMQKAGVSLVVWQGLRDATGGPDPGGGLEYSNGTPKPTMSAFGFPFIASVKGREGYAWGRTPLRHASTVFVQRQVKGRWRRVATVKTDGYGVFQAHFKARGNATYRAQMAHSPSSLPYFSAKIPPRRTHAYSFG